MMQPSAFQSFAKRGDSGPSKQRVGALRALLQKQRLDGFILPRADEFQNEYVPQRNERLCWLTGFSGSAGTALVLMDRVLLFVDGRYSVQALAEIDPDVVTVLSSIDMPVTKWLKEQATKAEFKLGYDAWQHTPAQTEALRKSLSVHLATLCPIDNPIDTLWTERPALSQAPFYALEARYTGEHAVDKVERIRAQLDRAEGLFVSDPHAVAWAFNLRGADVRFTPLPLARAYIPAGGPLVLLAPPEKLTVEVRAVLPQATQIRDLSESVDLLRSLGQQKLSVIFDRASVPQILLSCFETAGGLALLQDDPISLLKARKNAVEITGSRAAHLRDGVAMVRFLAWFDREVSSGKLTEIDAALALEAFRRQDSALRDLSFPTISAANSHAALPHYGVSEVSNEIIRPGLFLIDSGGQYFDGTTDITRTIAVGDPTAQMRDLYTRVLKGHIAIARAIFPKGTSGAQIDCLARAPLWQIGLDFDHGTGHGIGAFLSVHEGPQRISKMGFVALEPGMILSNEPGYYKVGHYGIRLENLLVVEPIAIEGADRDYLAFETLTFAPFDLRLIDRSLLSQDEVFWLNDYHQRVVAKLNLYLQPDEQKWLAQAVRSL